MSKETLKIWQCRLLPVSKRLSKNGFTLMELLIAVAISSIVVSGLLYLVVELLRIDNREVALEEVQRDTQRALNYIADDLREAVFVYQKPIDLARVTDDLTGVGPALPAGSTPILAFWKATPIASSPPDPPDKSPFPDCATFPAGSPKINVCNALKIRRASYDLVVYSQINKPAGSWKGKSRISRYILRQYDNTLTLEENKGYIDPSSAGSSFENWVRQTTEVPKGSSQVLVDYIAEGTTTADENKKVKCSNWIPGNVAEVDVAYVPFPSSAKSDTSFFACIRSSDTTDDGDRFNQDVYLFLKGDASSRSSSLSPSSEASRSPILQTQVLIRGILNKKPAD